MAPLTHKKEHILLTAKSILIFLLSLLIVLLLNLISYKIEIPRMKDKYALQLFDQIDHEKLMEYFHNDLEREKLFNYVKEVSSQNEYAYLEIIKQPLVVKKLEFQEIKDIEYKGDGNNLDGSGNAQIMFINAMQISDNVFREFQLEVEKGDSFKCPSYMEVSASGMMDCILGHNYDTYYSPGDKISVVYMNKKMTLNIIGIVAKDSAVFHNGKYSKLDNYIIMPSLRIDNISADTIEDKVFLTSLASQKINGMFIIDGATNVPSCLLHLKNLTYKYRLPQFGIVDMYHRIDIIVLTILVQNIRFIPLVALGISIGALFVIAHIIRPKLIVYGRKGLIITELIFLVIISLICAAQIIIFYNKWPFSIFSIAYLALMGILPYALYNNLQGEMKNEEK